MGFNVYTSNNIEELSKIFCKSIENKHNWTDITQIVVQTEGVKKWLTDEVTSSHKIFANYDFTYPDGFIDKLYKLAEINHSSFFSAENIKWVLFKLLNSTDFKNKFSAIHSYYNGDNVKRIQLATKTADLFEQYQIYRTKYINAWSNGECAVVDTPNDDDFKKHEEWQKWLWIKLKENKDAVDKLQQKKILIEKLSDDDVFKKKLKANFPKVSLFAIAVISDFHMDIYQKLSEVINIDLYITSPSDSDNWYSKEYKNDENELLSSCKTLSSNLFSLINNNSNIINKCIKPNVTNLLSTIQSDIYTNNNSAISLYEPIKTDTSVHIVSSFTPIREVEALYNYLLNEFEEDENLKTSDISVQVTDMNIYAPLVKAVFDNAPRKLPYQINDLPYSNGDSIIKALQLLFELPNSNFKAENVMQLLEFKAVRNKFGFTDVATAKQIVADANIRYGIEGKKKDDTYLFSWKHGLTKLILGYAIKGGNSYEDDDIDCYPTDNIEGSEALNIFRIKALFDAIENIHNKLQVPKNLEEWNDFLKNDIINNLFDTTDKNYNDESETDYETEINYINKKPANIKLISKNIEEEIPFNVFQQDLLVMLNSEDKKSYYLNGSITFSTLIPVRSIPFKHIAILGLNSGVFPRDKQNLGFDLINIDPKPNDRNTKDNDKHLFLEAILSAKDKLYLSYIGRSIKDNSELPPSLLVEELKDYLKIKKEPQKWVDKNVIYNHPLHSTSKKYSTNGRLFTYFGKTTKHNDEKKPPETQDLDFNEIDINDLIKFFKDPIKWYYNKTLKIYYGDDDVLLPEEEPFELDTLQQWALKHDLVTIEESEEQECIKKKKNDGKIQLANMAEVELSKRKEGIEDIKKKFIDVAKGEPESKAITVKVGDTVLNGKIKSIYNNVLVCYNVSGSQAKHLMEAWIKHLALIASKKNIETAFVSSAYHFTISNNEIGYTEAQETLQQLVHYYKQGHSMGIPFLPNIGDDFITNRNNEDKKREVGKKAKQENELINNAFKKLKKEGETDFNKDYYNHYIKREIEISSIDTLKEYSPLFKEISKLLFSKIQIIIQQ